MKSSLKDYFWMPWLQQPVLPWQLSWSRATSSNLATST